MGTQERTRDAAVKTLERLAAPGVPPVSFLVAIRLLERILGTRVDPKSSVSVARIRFTHQQSLMSQPNEVSSIEAVPRYGKGAALPMTEWAYDVCTCFLGLTGSDSPLPLYMASEFAQDGEEMTLQRAFLDVFHNRIHTLFFRGVARYDFPGEVVADGTDIATWRALAMAGIDVARDQDLPVSRVQLLHVSGLFAQGPRTPRSLRNGLRALLRKELDGAGLQLKQFTGGWVPLDPDQWNSIGKRNNEPARTFVIGTRVRHPSGEARLVVGPLNPSQAPTFSPGGKAFDRILRLTELFSDAPVNLILELHVRTGDYPPFMLGRRRLARDAFATARRGGGQGISISHFPLRRERAPTSRSLRS